MKIARLALVVAVMPHLAAAEGWSSAGSLWSGTYNFPTANDRQVRLNSMEMIRRVENGAFDPVDPFAQPTAATGPGETIYDSRIGDIVINAAEGAVVDFHPRTGQNAGTSTSTIGAMNSTTSNISNFGDSNLVDISSNSASTGCQDGSISVASTRTSAALDISAAGAAHASAGAGTGFGSCN